MNLFHRIDDAQAIVRLKGGVFKQTEVYRRDKRIYVKHGGGFIRVLQFYNGVWGTSAPNVSVIDIDLPSVSISLPKNGSEMLWEGE